MFFPFSETMLDKFVKEDRMNALGKLRLYIMVLEMVDKPKQALWVLTGPLVSTFPVNVGSIINMAPCIF